MDEMVKGKNGRIVKWQGEVPFPEIPNANFASFLLARMSKHGENDAALVNGQTGAAYTYGDLLRNIPKIRSGLVTAGVRPGDKVFLGCRNHIDMPVALLSIILAEATCVLVNPASTKEELKHIIGLSESRWVIAQDEKVAQTVEDAFKELSPNAFQQLWVIDETTSARPSLSDLISSSTPELPHKKEVFDAATTVALMPLSSGTTGLPKGVMLSHRNLIATQIQRAFSASLSPLRGINVYQSAIIIIPMYHMMGFNMVMNTLFSGGKAVIFPRFTPKEYFSAIEKHKVTLSPVVPYVLRYLETSHTMKNHDLSSLITFVTGSEPVSASTLTNVTKKSGRMAMQGWGMSETTGIGTATSTQTYDKEGCVGKFQPFFQAKVIDLETGEMLGEGQEGELCVRGASIMLGYANNPKATAETIDPEGWLHTGDLVYFDEEDNFYVTGRIKDLIKVKGYQVAPAELENIIRKMEGVRDVAVAGIPDERLGEVPKAWVVPRADAVLDTKAIIENVAAQVTPYKQLAGGVEVVHSIPRNHIGKVLRRQLRKPYEDKSKRSKL
ncbi:uncharacterized protein LOC135201767 [Macrobrachium nipponense]|uniref:uncharacterized protein LOC135201767 n=1 Tax=Macrobrachium nipponense TaxID=159736 RepID=UPI0030C7A49D